MRCVIVLYRHCWIKLGFIMETYLMPLTVLEQLVSLSSMNLDNYINSDKHIFVELLLLNENEE